MSANGRMPRLNGGSEIGGRFIGLVIDADSRGHIAALGRNRKMQYTACNCLSILEESAGQFDEAPAGPLMKRKKHVKARAEIHLN